MTVLQNAGRSADKQKDAAEAANSIGDDDPLQHGKLEPTGRTLFDWSTRYRRLQLHGSTSVLFCSVLSCGPRPQAGYNADQSSSRMPRTAERRRVPNTPTPDRRTDGWMDGWMDGWRCGTGDFQ
jgi:hypothetical protein